MFVLNEQGSGKNLTNVVGVFNRKLQCCVLLVGILLVHCFWPININKLLLIIGFVCYSNSVENLTGITNPFFYYGNS